MSLIDQVMKVARASAKTHRGAGILRRLKNWRNAERLIVSLLALPKNERAKITFGRPWPICRRHQERGDA